MIIVCSGLWCGTFAEYQAFSWLMVFTETIIMVPVSPDAEAAVEMMAISICDGMKYVSCTSDYNGISRSPWRQ